MNTQIKTALVTGSSGFIGFHTAKRLLEAGWNVVGLDAMTDYYDVSLKQARLAILQGFDQFTNVEATLEAEGVVDQILKTHKPNTVIHLAAQAGVRYSIDAPRSYVDSNIRGTFEILEAVRTTPVDHLLMASTSSVYGANTKMPYAETDQVDHQMSFYAATKKAGEAMAHTYSHLYGIPTTMFRFFTVYGPWGRPDMALFKFTKAILADEPIDIYNHGNMQRDFTYVDDLVTALTKLIEVPPLHKQPQDSLSPIAPWRVVNIGNDQPVKLMAFVEAVERALGKTAQKNLMEKQAGDVFDTWADVSLLRSLIGTQPQTDLDTGIAAFVAWYKEHYA
ncbi:SDR family NAD(P)-dependent oxidoreductase [Algirhabdus cladophorae]|uniref:SDR family NAD(P)-dependent oxidoreductase n=1 Tax=Algirhabdus cladophorae TaxID=3377108 RepID=UPI003B849FDF